MLNRHSLLPTLALAALLLPGTPVAKDRVKEPINGTFEVSERPRLSVENINGFVHITTWDRDVIQVDGVRSAKNQDRLDDIEVELHADDDFVRVRARYKGNRNHYDGDDARVDFEIKVPKHTLIEDVSLVNGELTIKGVAGDVNASTVNGTLSAVDLTGDVELSTVNGTLNVEFESLARTASIDLSTVNGTVEIKLPRKAGARLSASTVNGAITSDLGLTVSKLDVVGRSMKGTIGDGGASIDVSAVNGAIRISGGDGAN